MASDCALTVAAGTGGLREAAALLALALAAPKNPYRTGAREFVICVDSGVHELDAPWRLDGRHSGRVRWRGPADGMAIVSGATNLTKWVRCAESPRWCFDQDDVWVHENAPWRTRQLWVDGERVSRSEVRPAPGSLEPRPWGYERVGAEPMVVDWRAGAEFRWPKQVRNWIEPRCGVAEARGAQIVVEETCWRDLIDRNGGAPPPAPDVVENVFGHHSRMDPGTFASLDDVIFYKPRAGHQTIDGSSDFVVVAPRLETLLALDGVVGKNHTFENLHFQFATWADPSVRGYVPAQTAVQTRGNVTTEPSGAVAGTNVSGVVVANCTFLHLGTAYALSVGGGSRGVSVERCHFEDLSGGAVKLGDVDEARCSVDDEARRDADFVIEDCFINHAGLEFRDAAAIFAGYVASTTVRHNTIQHTGYTAISLGWGWGAHVAANASTFMRDNHVVANHISSVMTALNDGGCIYTLGPQPGSTVRENYCRADEAPVVGCFYHDNGSRGFLTTGNVAADSRAPCVFLQGCPACCDDPAFDIRVEETWCRETAPLANGCAFANCTVDNATLYYVTANWPPEALAIIDAAGRRDP